jgi:hypothetical protein
MQILQRSREFPNRIYRHEIATGRNQPWREIMPADPTRLFEIDIVRIAKDGATCVYSARRGLTEVFYARGLK